MGNLWLTMPMRHLTPDETGLGGHGFSRFAAEVRFPPTITSGTSTAEESNANRAVRGSEIRIGGKVLHTRVVRRSYSGNTMAPEHRQHSERTA